MNIQLYSPFRIGKEALDSFTEDYLKLDEFKQSCYNIKNIAMNLEILTLEYTNNVLKIIADQNLGI